MELLERHFDIALETPDGIKKLRELILTLAMKGKLVKQDSKDQPVDELLEDVETEKQKLFKDGKIKKYEKRTPIKLEEIPYNLPVGWEWVRLTDLGITQTGTTPKNGDPESYGNDYPFIKPADITANGINYDNEGLSEKGLIKYGRIAAPGSSLMVCIGTIGKTNITTKTVSFNQQINSLTPYNNLNTNFIQVGFRTPYFQREAWSRSSSTTLAILNKGRWENIPFPLCPLTEQQRIVGKINQLMALCDKLEAERNERDKSKLKIHSTVMNKLLSAPDSSAFNSSWSFITKHFSELYSVTQNVDELKKAILQLAVMGKLVPQDVNDQPASELLREIEVEKERLVKDGKIKKQEKLPPVKQEDIPHQLPKGWVWVRLGDVFILKSGISFNQEDELKDGKYIYLKVGEMNLVDNKTTITTSSIFLNENKKVLNSLIPENSIIFPKRGGAIATNKKRLVRTPICVDTNIMAIICPPKIDLLYAYNWFMTHDLALLNTGTSVPQINNKEISPLFFPVPPLCEQKRIVKRIDQFMELCNSLEQQIKDSTGKKSEILEAVLARV